MLFNIFEINVIKPKDHGGMFKFSKTLFEKKFNYFSYLFSVEKRTIENLIKNIFFSKYFLQNIFITFVAKLKPRTYPAFTYSKLTMKAPNMYEIVSKLAKKTPERRHLWQLSA